MDSSVELTVANDGPHIPAYALDRVFDRFYSLPRPETGEKSSGLGLTFVREVALLHGGKVTITNQPGSGVKATLRLPVSPPDV
jgi:two-component system sensor histidine kinase CreC